MWLQQCPFKRKTVATGVQQTMQSAAPLGVCLLISVSLTVDEGMAHDCQVWQTLVILALKMWRRDPETPWTANLTYLTSTGPRETLSQKNKGGGLLRAPRVDLWPTHTQARTHAHTEAQVCTTFPQNYSEKNNCSNIFRPWSRYLDTDQSTDDNKAKFRLYELPDERW